MKTNPSQSLEQNAITRLRKAGKNPRQWEDDLLKQARDRLGSWATGLGFDYHQAIYKLNYTNPFTD